MMMWPSALSVLRPQRLWSSLAGRGLTTVTARTTLPTGRGIGPAVANGSSPRAPWEERVGRQGGQQCRGMMAVSNRKHKKILKMAKGFGRTKKVFKIAIQKVEKSLQHAYRDRKNKKRDFRRLWIERINAGVRQHGMAYSVFVNQARKADVELNRKVLADMAVTEPYSFRAVVETVKAKGGAKV